MNVGATSADDLLDAVQERLSNGYKEWVYAVTPHVDLFPRRRKVELQHVWLVPEDAHMPDFRMMVRYAGIPVKVRDTDYGTIIEGKHHRIILVPEYEIAVIDKQKISIYALREWISSDR